MTAANGSLARALAAHRAGRIGEAAAAYRGILGVDPDHMRARHLLGFALLQLGWPQQAAVELATSAPRLRDSPDAWAHLGLALRQLNRTAEAAAALRRALVLTPSLAEAAAAMADLATDRNDGSAERLARRCVALDPGQSSGWHRLGLHLARQAPDERSRVSADAMFRRAVVLNPRDVPSVTDLADLRRSRRRPEDARSLALRSLRLHPGSVAARVTLAAALLDLDRPEPSGTAARTAAALDPSVAAAYANLGQCLYGEGLFAAALRAGGQARAVSPGDPQVQANLATYHLAVGELDAGWDLFRHRPSARLAVQRTGLPPRRWAGEPSPGLLVLAEQGLGDELLFASCWPDLAALVRAGKLGTVVVELDPRLRPLAERSFPELRWRHRHAPRAEDVGLTMSHWAAAGDLPALFRRHIEDFPAGAGYLTVDSCGAAGFRRWLDAEAPGLRRLGLCWRSGLQTADRTRYYPRLQDCTALGDLPGVRLVALQYDDFEQDLAETRPGQAPRLLVPPDLDRRDDLDGVAALIAALDGVLTADTAVLALAGAVGAPTVAFGRRPTWVTLGEPRSPWYRSVTSFHRRPGESWASLMERIARSGAGPLTARAG